MTDLEQAEWDLDNIPFLEFKTKWESRKEIWDKLIWELKCEPGKPCQHN